MIKVAIALILISGVTIGTAYFYLPENPQTPATAASRHQPEPSPRPGQGRYDAKPQPPQPPQPPETYIPLGLLLVGVLWLKSVSES